MKLSIQLHLAGLSLSNTVSFLEVFGVDRVRSTVHNWVHKADLQPVEGQQPDHVATDETVVQLDDDRYWLFAAVDHLQHESKVIILTSIILLLLEQIDSSCYPQRDQSFHGVVWSVLSD